MSEKREFSRRSVLAALTTSSSATVVPLASSAGVAAQTTSTSDRTFTLEQGDRAVEVTPLSYGDQSITEFYGYTDHGHNHANTTTGIERSDTSELFLYDGPNGLNLVVIHDAAHDGSGGAASFDFTGLPETAETIFTDSFDDGDISDWSTYTDGDASVTTDDGRLRLRVFRCSTARATRAVGKQGYNGPIEVSFSWTNRADGWWERTDWRLEDRRGNPIPYEVVSGNDLENPDDYSTKSGSVTVRAYIDEIALIKFAVTPSTHCDNFDHYDTFLWIDDLAVREPGGEWVVRDDDPGNDDYSSTTVDWRWFDVNTDGGAFRGGLDGDFEVTVEPSFGHGIDEWQFLSGDASYPERVSLDPSSPVVVHTGEPEPDPRLAVDRMRPVQVVFDADPNDDGQLDLVKDKATAVLVYPGGSKLDELSSSVDVQAQVVDGNGNVELAASTTLSASEYRSLAADGDYVELRVEVPEQGERTIRTTVDPGDGGESGMATETVSVAETEGIDLAYFRVVDVPYVAEFGEPTQQEFEDHIDHSDEFVPATFPVAESNYNTGEYGDYVGDPLGEVVGIWDDLASLDYWAWHHTNGARGVGVTNEGYWSFHNKGSWRGATSPHSNSFLVAEGYWVTTAHELGHQLGLHTGTEEYDLGGRDRGDGYWVERGELIQNRVAFMEGYVHKSFDRWVSNDKDDADDFEDYDHMFRQKLSGSVPTASTADATDGDLLYLRGRITDDGTLTTSTTDYHTDGDLVPTDDGDYAVVARDADGGTVAEKSFAVSFKLLVDGTPDGPFETDAAAFSFPMPYPTDARTLELRKDGETVASFQTTTKLLHDAIDRVPADGFRQPGNGKGGGKGNGQGGSVAENRRNALHNKVDAVERMLDAGNERGARRKLSRDVKPAVERWLVDGYDAPTPDDVSKAELLTIVERHVERLA